MRLALIISVWARHDLESLVIARFRTQAARFGFEIIIAGSEGKKSRALAKGCHYIEIPNTPVSNKHNALIDKARKLNVDGVVLMGSDDMVDDKFWKFINTFSPQIETLVGLSDIYFYSTKTKELGYWKSNDIRKQTIGAGRFFSRFVLDKMNWNLWDEGLNKGLDTNCSGKLKQKGISETIHSMEEADVFLMDIKHTISITKHAILNMCENVNIEIMAKRVTKKAAEQVQALQPKPIEVKETIDVTYFTGEKEFVSNGTSKHLPKGKVVMVSYEMARLFTNRGFGQLA